jgi:hypothetical protein
MVQQLAAFQAGVEYMDKCHSMVVSAAVGERPCTTKTAANHRGVMCALVEHLSYPSILTAA